MAAAESAMPAAAAGPAVRRRHPLAAALLLLTAVAILVLRGSESAAGRWLAANLSLEGLDASIGRQMQHVLMVPLGSLVVVFCRLTLGVRMLGPFRPILIALAMLTTGVAVGLAFTVLVLAVIVAVRPRLERHGLPYFSRLSLMLAGVVLLQVAFVLGANAMAAEHMILAAYFPIVVLCLAADGFARVLASEGLRAALWRGTTTLVVAVAITLLYQVPGLDRLTARYPELLLAEIAGILLVSDWLRLGLLDRLNPQMPASVYVED